MNSKNFYDTIADIYEKMIDFEKNLQLRISAYKNIFPVKGKVVDIGCGVGLDSIALAKNGHEVTSFDISPNMIEASKQNASKYSVNVEASVNSFTSIEKNYYNKFDYAVSVGNTIAHLKPCELKKAINKIYKILKPGGKVFLHILNYDLIIKNSKRINNIANTDGKIIIRFYDFKKTGVNFNILSFRTNNPKEFNFVTTKHYPHTRAVILSHLNNAGFKRVKFLRNFGGEKFNVSESKDLFVEAIKK